ncbi:GNAT family N-acetyltransferase [Bacillus shivajii]|uniref:GNAT family N-acetyltransferase n=1 Tax=Bacillus shivajii TaxID=1983719 RepID=UPI001CFA4873|nr:GNAT family N-acetyltransferase [Bacillus shivajii]UCZ55252.1 GNAT family N-acetyltransferase [Bacillus shivajii]
MRIRSIETTDSKDFLHLNKQLDSETSFMLYEPDERQLTVEQQEKIISKIREKQEKEIYVVEYENDKLVGYIALFGGEVNRNRHSAYIVMGILKSYQGRGIGTKLFEKAHQWAEQHGIHRFELTVMKHNEHAVHLYKKQGFEIEGVKRDSLKVNDEYVDEYYLSKLLT